MSVPDVLAVPPHALSDVAGAIRCNAEDLLPQRLLAERWKVVGQMSHKLAHTDLLSSPDDRLLFEEVVLVFWLRVQAHVRDMHGRIEILAEGAARICVWLGGKETLAILLDKSFKRTHVCDQ